MPSTPPSRKPDSICGFLAALSFLSRLGPPQSGVSIGIPWHGAAGLALGCIMAISAGALAWLLGSNPLAPLLAGWLWLTMETWLTRGLHWDGVADLGDALGAGASGEKFRAILKDSHTGAFGVMTLGLLMGGQWLGASAHLNGLEPATLASLACAPAWARLAPAWLGMDAKAWQAKSLGALICGHVTRKLWLGAWLQGFVFLAIPCLLGMAPVQALSIFLAQSGLNLWFRRAGNQHGGLSGDFFGCHIESSQLLYLLLSIPARI